VIQRSRFSFFNEARICTAATPSSIQFPTSLKM
jgi:hypothetical protein